MFSVKSLNPDILLRTSYLSVLSTRWRVEAVATSMLEVRLSVPTEGNQTVTKACETQTTAKCA